MLLEVVGRCRPMFACACTLRSLTLDVNMFIDDNVLCNFVASDLPYDVRIYESTVNSLTVTCLPIRENLNSATNSVIRKHN